MTNPDAPRVVSERTVRRECAGCGGPLTYTGTGRPPRYCSAACRHRGWVLRLGERAVGTEADTRPAVVHEVVERTVERIVQAPIASATSNTTAAASTPSRAREWVALIDQLTGQLANDAAPVTREHFHHRALYRALHGALTMLGDAHPGGPERLQQLAD